MNVKERLISVIRSLPVQTHVVHIPARVTRDTLEMGLNALFLQVSHVIGLSVNYKFESETCNFEQGSTHVNRIKSAPS